METPALQRSSGAARPAARARRCSYWSNSTARSIGSRLSPLPSGCAGTSSSSSSVAAHGAPNPIKGGRYLPGLDAADVGAIAADAPRQAGLRQPTAPSGAPEQFAQRHRRHVSDKTRRRKDRRDRHRVTRASAHNALHPPRPAARTDQPSLLLSPPPAMLGRGSAAVMAQQERDGVGRAGQRLRQTRAQDAAAAVLRGNDWAGSVHAARRACHTRRSPARCALRRAAPDPEIQTWAADAWPRSWRRSTRSRSRCRRYGPSSTRHRRSFSAARPIRPNPVRAMVAMSTMGVRGGVSSRGHG